MGTLINQGAGGVATIAASAGFTNRDAAPADEASAARVLIGALTSSDGIAALSTGNSAAVTGALALANGSSTEVGDELAEAATTAGFATASDDTLGDLYTALTS